MHWNRFREKVVLVLTLFILCGTVQAQGLDPTKRTWVIIGCAIGGTILLIVIVILLVLCCKSSKKEKELKKKGQYQQFHDPFLTKTYNHPVSRAPNGHTNGHVQRLAAPKLERSRSDLQGTRPNYVMPEWRHRQAGGDNSSQLSARRDSGSDISTPNGIWTSNPTLTRGLPPGQVVRSSGGPNVPNGRSYMKYGSEPTLNAKQKLSKWKHKRKHGTNAHLLDAVDEESDLAGTSNPKAWDQPKSQKPPSKQENKKAGSPQRNPSTNKRDSDIKRREDKKELLQANGRDSATDGDSHMVARAYSNPAFKQEAPVPPSKTPGQDGPFVAKVYSDYQLPRDFLPDNTSNVKQGGKVAKAIGGNPKDNVNRRSRDSQSRTDHTKVRPNSFDSNGEPKYMYPQDAYRMTQSDWVLLNKNTKQVSRTQSNMEKGRPPGVVPVSKGKKPQRSASQMVGKYDPGLHGKNDRGPSQVTNVRMSQPSMTGSGIQIQTAGVHEQNKKNKKLVKEGKRKSKSSPREEKEVKPSKMDKNRNTKGLTVDIEAARSNSPQISKHPIEHVDIDGPNSGLNSAQPLVDPDVRQVDQSSRRISESSSIPVSPEPVVQAEVAGDGGDGPMDASQNITDIYAVPLKRDSRPNSQIVWDDTKTPLSPDPPPVPPVTELREETESRPASVHSRRRIKSATSDGDGLSTGKNVIGDAFQFLDDFDDTSIDGELEKF